jgi:hypothetical protein
MTNRAANHPTFQMNQKFRLFKTDLWQSAKGKNVVLLYFLKNFRIARPHISKETDKDKSIF